MLYNRSVEVTPCHRPSTRQTRRSAMSSISVRVCAIDGCENKPRARGLCKSHYYQLKRRNELPPKKDREIRLCSVEGCSNKHFVHDLCSKHWLRMSANGHLEVAVIRGDDEKRFWSHVNKNGPLHPKLGTRCWLWTSKLNRFGYAPFHLTPKNTTAHRFSYILAHGEIPEGEGYHGTCVLHQCDVRHCVNPEHLFLGTNQDNVDDKVAKGRGCSLPGELHPMAKLKKTEVLEIRRLYAAGSFTRRELEEMYGLARGSAKAIIARRTWRHI